MTKLDESNDERLLLVIKQLKKCSECKMFNHSMLPYVILYNVPITVTCSGMVYEFNNPLTSMDFVFRNIIRKVDRSLARMLCDGTKVEN